MNLDYMSALKGHLNYGQEDDGSFSLSDGHHTVSYDTQDQAMHAALKYMQALHAQTNNKTKSVKPAPLTANTIKTGSDGADTDGDVLSNTSTLPPKPIPKANEGPSPRPRQKIKKPKVRKKSFTDVWI